MTIRLETIGEKILVGLTVALLAAGVQSLFGISSKLAEISAKIAVIPQMAEQLQTHDRDIAALQAERIHLRPRRNP